MTSDGFFSSKPSMLMSQDFSILSTNLNLKLLHSYIMNIGSIWNYWNLIGWTLSTVYFSDAISFYYKHSLTMSCTISMIYFSTAVSTRADPGTSADQQYCHQLEAPPQPHSAWCQVLPCLCRRSVQITGPQKWEDEGSSGKYGFQGG